MADPFILTEAPLGTESTTSSEALDDLGEFVESIVMASVGVFGESTLGARPAIAGGEIDPPNALSWISCWDEEVVTGIGTSITDDGGFCRTGMALFASTPTDFGVSGF